MLNESYKFEQCRINQLHEERLYIQKKTFTKWMNSFLQKVKMEVDDIFVDLADGKKLLKLFEIISGEKLGKPNNGKMRVHKIENVNKCLAFLHTKVHLESIGAEDIVDGNKTLILGLLWTIILRFQIQDIEIELDEESDKKHSSKDALLLWCQRKTKGYQHVNVKDFSQSWRSGMAFNALIHSHRPELIDYNSLNPNNHIDNLNNAFDVAKKNLAIQPLLDSEDIDIAKPDERSILTYVSSYYHTFAKYNSEVISGKRIANIISQLMEIDRCQLNYEMYTASLLNWIQMKIYELNNRDFPNNLDKIHIEFIKFKEYRTVEKPPKYKERSEIEALLFNIQTKMKSLGQSSYIPPEGKLVQDIQKSWVNLEKAEHKRELALREEMIRLEKFNNLADSFFRKSDIRKGYLTEMITVLTDARYGTNLSQVEATVKKHEAICADILSRNERIEALSSMVAELENGNFYNIEGVKVIEQEIVQMWGKLIGLLKYHQTNLSIALKFMNSKREMETVENELNELKNRMNIDSNVSHLRAFEEYLQSHSLMEAQILSHGDAVNRLTKSANKLVTDDVVLQSNLVKKEIPKLNQCVDSLNATYTQLTELASDKRKKLLDLQIFYKLLQDIDEEDTSLSEKINICQAILPGKDLLAIISIQQKHNVFEAEVKSHDNRLKKIITQCKPFTEADHSEKYLIQSKLDALLQKWQQLQSMTNQKSKELTDAIEAFQYHADANEAESWIKEKMQLAKSEDYGNDKQSAESLLQRHSRLESEVTAYEHDIERLNYQSDKMINSGVENLFLLSGDPFLTHLPAESIEESPEEPVAEVLQQVYEEYQIDRVIVLYSYKSQENYHVKKGEELILLEKSNKEWWKVMRETEERKGYVPANYVKQIEPKFGRRLVTKPVANVEKPQSKPSKSKYNRRNSKRRLSIVCTADTAEQRKSRINVDYNELVQLCKHRRELLEDSVRMFRFKRECELFEVWIDQTETEMTKANNIYNEKKHQNDIGDPVNKLSQQFDNFITDLLANRSRLEDIDKMASEISSPLYVPITTKKREDVHKKWDNLNLLQKQLGKNIEGLTTIEIFNSSCDEAAERINDKLYKINYTQDIGKDLKTVQALQRRHENIVRELMPIEDTLKKINILSENVKSSYPLQKEHVAKRLNELNDLWDQLKASSVNKRSVLDKMIGLQIFKNSTADMMMWMKSYVRPLLQYDKEDSLLKDLANLDLMIKEHNDLFVDLKGKSNDINDLNGLRNQLSTLVTEEETNNLEELIAEYDNVYKDWQKKENFLKQCKNLLSFNQQADHIDTIINSNLSVLEFDHLGKNINDVAFLIKQHETFQTKLYAQDQRIHNFGDFGEKLIQNKHYDSDKIEARRNKIFEHRKTLNDKAFDRNKQLMDAKIYHEIKSDGDEFLNWCHDKIKLIDDNDLKNINNMERKFKRHQAIAAEVRANKSQLDKIQKAIRDINKNSHVSFSELEQIASNVRSEWDKLINLIENKDIMLNQAFQQIKHTKSLDLIDERVLEIGKIIHSTDYGVDRRSCKNLIQQNKAVENEIEMIDSKLNELKNKRQENDHPESDVVIKNCDKLCYDLNSLREPLIRHKQKLQDSYKFYEFEFDINAELQWIKEHMSLATSTSVPQNLIDAQNAIKKFENLKREVDGHENYINNIVNKGQELIGQNHFALDKIQAMINQLQSEWQNLLHLMEKRNNTLQASLRIQQLLSECVEIESWMSEKLNILNSGIHGKEETSVVKLLQKQKTTDLEIDTYSGLIEELNRQIDSELDEQTLSEQDHKMLKSRVNDLNVQIKNLQKLTNERSLALMELKKIHEFYREKNDFLSWISKQKQILLNDDYGKDFEHCSILQANFFDLKRLIASNEGRFNQCIKYATSLTKNDDDKRFTDDIVNIKNAWDDLLTIVNGKENKFVAAIEIHRFNRDVAESYSRIKEKSAILDNQDFGRDTHSVQNLIRKHDIFENDLVVLEAQLQILINDSVKLKAAYAGENAKNIAEQSKIVVDSWNLLKEKSSVRSQNLYDAEEYYQCSSMIRNLEQWADNLIVEMNSLETVQDVQSSQAIKVAHERLKIEIDLKEDEFSTVVQKTNFLTSKPFYPELKSSTERLLSKRNELHNAWQNKNVYLDQLIDLNCFLRDIKQLDQQCRQHLNRLNSLEFGNTVEEVDSNLKKLEEFIKLFESQETKYNNAKECANKLVQKNHIKSETIQTSLSDLLNKRAKLLSFILERKDELTDALILVQFKRDVHETELWIEEKRNQIEKERHSIHADDDIELKIKKLMKHQTFEAEINANAQRIVEIQNKAKHLINKNHPSSIEIRTQHDDLFQKWNELLKLSKEMLQGFEEAKDIYEFNRNIAQIESWIRDKELMIQFNDTGEDYEHCNFLLRKLDDVDTDLKVDENRILQINNLANRLTNQHRPEFFNEDKVNKQKMALNESWQQLQQKISDYRDKLTSSLEIHSLNRDLDDINQRIMEKDLAVANEYDGKNLTAIESMKRKHEAIVSDIHTIENQFKIINENEARRLITKYPELCEKSRSKIQIIQDNLRLLNKDCKSKENKLNFSITVHKFFVLVKEVENWANDILTNKLGNVSTSVTVTEAKEDLQNHEYVKAEILARRDNHQTLKEYGISLLKQMGQENLSQDEKAQQIENCIQKIDELRKKLDLAWEEKHIYLKQCLERIIFNDLSKLSDSWLSTKEAYLTNEDLGTNLASVEELLKKHEIFSKSLTAQQRVTDFVTFGEALVRKQHFETASIQAKLTETLARRDKLLETSKFRQNKLDDSKIFYKFLRNVNEIQRWLNEKLKVAMDESYREPINLLSKRQKHAAFEAEIIANKERVDAVIIEGENLINSSHFKSEQIKAHLIEIEMLVRSLNEQANNKQLCLNDAYEALQFDRLCEDLELWIKDIEGILSDGDHGKDLTSVKNLLKKHQQTENDIHNHNENVEQVKNKLVEFTQNNHFLKDDIEAKAQQIVHKYNSILEPMNNRREFLEEFLSFYQFKRDIEDEFVWIVEKENQMKHFDNGCSLQEIQRLVRKHKMFESEFQVRESHLSALVSKGHNLIKSSNNNSEEIKQLTYELQNKIQKLKDESSFRLLRLYDSLESQQFYTDVSEAESWLNERMPFLLSEDTGKDEESVIASMKKLEVVNKDTDRFFSSTLAKLMQQSDSFAEKNHFDSLIIKEKFNDLNSLFNQCVQLSERKRDTLLKRRNYFAFERDADELILWIKDQLIIANSDDYGQDVDHIEKLIVQFQTVISSINANQDRIDSVKFAAQDVENSSEKLEQIMTLWNKLKEDILHREENLKNAKKVHTYNRSVDETICWIREKDSSTILEEVNLNYDDLDTIQAKIRGLEGFERDLKAVREQVEFLYEEADKLTASFPNLNDIEQKKNTVYDIWNALLSKTELHRNNLNQIEKIQSYLDEYQDLFSWINKMQALITADDKLATDAISAEEQINRHKEYKIEIDMREDHLKSFLANGENIISQGHFKSDDIKERNTRITSLHKTLTYTWHSRNILFGYNFDARQFIQNAEQVEKWIDAHFPFVEDNNFGDSLLEVEDLILKHEEFEKTIQAQADKLKSIERITQIEYYFQELLQKEQEAKLAEENQREKDRQKQLLQDEQMKILNQRKNEEESRYYENGQFLDKKLNSASAIQKYKNTSKSPRRISSFAFSRKSHKVKPVEDIPPPIGVHCEGFLERKQILQPDGKKAASRSWKNYYTVLCGQLLCFFKDKHSFFTNEASSPPFSIHNARCLVASEYTKKKFVFSIQLNDMTKFLFAANDDKKLADWVNKITFRASLPPAKQLISNETIENNFPVSSSSLEPIADQKDSVHGSCSSSESSLASPVHQSPQPVYTSQDDNHVTNGQTYGQLAPRTVDYSKENQYINVPPIGYPAEVTYANGNGISERVGGDPLNRQSLQESSSNAHYDNTSPNASIYSQPTANDKCMSLPPNISPPVSTDQSSYSSLKQPSNSSVKSFDDNASLSGKKKNKMKSFFRRNK